MRPYHVAVVGSGPSGFFAAASLLKAADASGEIDVAVDMLEMLPTPWGLVRSGVAPDHPKIKSISKQFEKTADDPRLRFFGNVVVGEHVTPAELAERYDAVVYAVGVGPVGCGHGGVEGWEVAEVPEVDVERGVVAVANECFGVGSDERGVEEGEEFGGTPAASGAEDGVDGGVGEGGVEVRCAICGGPGIVERAAV